MGGACFAVLWAQQFVSFGENVYFWRQFFLKQNVCRLWAGLQKLLKSFKVLLDTVESALPEGLPENFAADCKFQETINKVIELLPDLWILSWAPEEAIVAYSHSSSETEQNRGNHDRSLEMEAWNDLSNLYTSLSLWWDAEVYLSKTHAISSHSASRWYSLGIVLRELYDKSLPVVKSLLTDAPRLDRTNPSARFNLGLLYKAENGGSAPEAAECLEAAALLQESEPVEPFR